jgi:hypothetical protein
LPNDYKYKLRDLAELGNIPIGWDDKTKTVSIHGQPFDTTGWQNIDGRFHGTEQMASDFMKNYLMPSGNVPTNNTLTNENKFAIPNYNPTQTTGAETTTPQYSNKINQLTNQLGQAVQNFGQPYDLNNDPIYQQLAEYQKNQMMQTAASRGMIYDDNTKARIEQSNMMLGQQFQQQDQMRQLQNIQNLQGQLGVMTGLEDRAMTRDNALYGMALTPQTRDYMNTMQNLSLEQRQFVDQYKDNYAAIINQLPEGDPNRKVFEAARFQKVISDPVEYRDYLINDYGLSPFQVDNIVIGRQIEQMQAQAKNEKEAMELEKLRLQVEKAGVDLIGAGIGNEKAYWESLISQIKASNLPQQLKANLQKTYADINRVNAATKLTQKKIDETTKGSSPMVYKGFNELVSFVKDGGSMLDWLSSMRGDPDRDGASMGYRVSEMYSPDELAEISKLAKQTEILNKNEVDPIEEAIAERIRRG